MIFGNLEQIHPALFTVMIMCDIFAALFLSDHCTHILSGFETAFCFSKWIKRA